MSELKINKIIKEVNGSYGQRYFEKLVLSMASVLELDHLFIARIDNIRTSSETLSYACKGKLVDNITYDLKDTPCKDVSNDSVMCITNNVTKLYPKDQFFQDTNMEGYIGLPLHSSHGDVMGLMVGMSENEIQNHDSIKTLFQIFSGRIVSEIERTELEKSNYYHIKRLERIFSGSNDGLWEWDIEKGIVYFSSSWKAMLGYKDDEIEHVFESWQNRVHPDDIDGVLKDVEMCLNDKNAVYENRYRMKHKDGSWIWILDRGKVEFNEGGKAILFSGTHTDVTKEKMLEQELIELNNSLEKKVDEKVKELQKSKHYYEEMVENLSDWIWEVDTDGVYTYCNKIVYDFIGYTSSEVIGKTAFDFMTPEEAAKIGKIFGSYVSKKQFFSNLENKNIHKDGHTVIFNTSGMPILDEEKNLLGYRGINRDITEVNKLKKEKDYHKEQMFQQSRMAQMGEMISMIAHQWRQPLGAISSTSIDLNMKIELETFNLEQDKGREECQAYFTNALNDIDEFVKSLTNTIDDFRNFYKPNKKSDTIKLEEICIKSLSVMKTSLINNNVNVIENYFCEDKLEIYTNEMIQVVLNILKNAQDNFLEKDIKEPYIKISTNDKVLSICDNGGGIPDDIIDKIFDPYFSTKDEKNGTGLGLYMSKMIVEEHHNAKLEVENTDGGVCFKVELGIISEE